MTLVTVLRSFRVAPVVTLRLVWLMLRIRINTWLYPGALDEYLKMLAAQLHVEDIRKALSTEEMGNKP
jgi:hypothetical protein